MDLGDLRQSYEQTGLRLAATAADPFDQFSEWFGQALDSGIAEPNAMAVTTVDPDGYPAARVVLLKSFDRDGFVFFTNYHSAKGADLEARPRAALLFSWIELHRQVRIVGDASRCSASESDDYFARRPRGSQIGAWASQQSTPVADRDALDAAWHRIEERFAGQEIPRPPQWGGYRVTPRRIEFWQGRPNRMHDRIVYDRTTGADLWQRCRLSP